MEFRHVLFIGIENFELPSGRNCYTKFGNKLDIDLLEESNIFYVGISRTIYELIFTASREVFKRGRKRKRVLSCLIEKIDNFVNFVDFNTGNLINYSENKYWKKN